MAHRFNGSNSSASDSISSTYYTHNGRRYVSSNLSFPFRLDDGNSYSEGMHPSEISDDTGLPNPTIRASQSIASDFLLPLSNEALSDERAETSFEEDRIQAAVSVGTYLDVSQNDMPTVSSPSVELLTHNSRQGDDEESDRLSGSMQNNFDEWSSWRSPPSDASNSPSPTSWNHAPRAVGPTRSLDATADLHAAHRTLEERNRIWEHSLANLIDDLEAARLMHQQLLGQSLSQTDRLIHQLQNASRISSESPVSPTSPDGPTSGNSTPLPTATASAARDFLESLGTLHVSQLRPDDVKCPICHDLYLLFGPLYGERPLVLPRCRHVFGHKCIGKWLDPSADPPRNTCPICRDVLFDLPEVHMDEDEDGDIEATQWSSMAFLASIEQSILQAQDQGLVRERQGSTNMRTFNPTSTTTTARAATTTTPNNPFTSFYNLNLHPHHPLLCQQILTHYRHFPTATFANADTIAAALARLMGQLIARLNGELERVHMLAPWGVEGPPVRWLFDAEMEGLLIGVLRRLGEVETDWVTTGAGRRE